MAAAATFTATFTTAGTFTWTCPAGVTAAGVQCWASGGGGGNSNSTTSGGGGGGGGEYAAEPADTVVASTAYTLTVAAAAVHSAGGSSTSFNGSPGVTASGGGVGTPGAGGGGGGAGGTGSTNTVHFNGGAGGSEGTTAGGGGGGSAGPLVNGNAGTSGSTAVGGAGAIAVAGGGPGGGGGNGAAAGSAPASGPGGGGGGGGAPNNFGGSSAAGQGIITWSMASPATLAASTSGGVYQVTAPAGATAVTWTITGTATFNGNSSSGTSAVTPGNSYVISVGSSSSLVIAFAFGIPDVPNILPGPTWLATFKPGMPRSRPLVPPSFINMVTMAGGAAMAPMAAGGNVQAAAPPMDLPAIRPGLAWLSHFKPGSRPRPPLAAQPPSGPNKANLPSFSDIPSIQPGPTWLMAMKPGWPRPHPLQQIGSPGPSNPGSAAMAPMAAGGTATVYPATSGGAGMAPMAAGGTVRVPIIVTSAGAATAPMAAGGTVAVPIVVLSAGAAMAPMRVVTPSFLRDLPSLMPGPTWLDHFKPGLAKTLKVPGGPQYIGARSAVVMAPMAASGQVTVYLPFPQFRLSLKYEILVNGTWTDISTFVYNRDDQVITRGLPDETQATQPGQLTLTLDDRDGRFSPLDPSGAYYPYLTRNVQLRCSIVNQASANGTPYTGYRFWGELSSIPPAWDTTGGDVYCQVTVSGPLRRFAQGAKMGSTLRQYYGGLTGNFAPYAVWPAEDGSTATEIASLLPAVPAMTFTGAPGFSSSSAFGGSDPIPTVSGSTWHGLTQASADPPGTGSISQKFPGTYTWTAPPGVSAVTGVTAIGAGGGGSDTDGTTGGGGGGGGGSQTTSSLAVTAGNAYHYTVGAGGAGGAAGSNGSGGTAGADSMFTGDAASVTGKGGGHGGGASVSSRGAGGAGLGFNGGQGGSGSASTTSNFGQSLTGSTGASSGGTGANGASTQQSWTAPPTTTEVSVTAGGAGGGGGRPTGANGSGGGAGGGWNSGTASVNPGQTYVLQAGNGGAGGNPAQRGNFGGNSGFTGQVIAGGGQGGAGGEAGGAGGGGQNTGGNGGSGNAGTPGSFGGGGGGGGSGAGPNSGGGTGGGNASNTRAPGAGSGNGGNGGWGKILPSGGQQTAGGAGSGSDPVAGGGGGGGGSVGTGNGTTAGGGGPGFVDWSWSETGVPAGGGGGASAGTSGSGGSGDGAGDGGNPPSGGGAGGSAGSSPNGVSPGGGGAGAVPSSSSAGSGAAGEVAFSWSGGATSPVAGDVVRFLLDIDSAGAADGAVLVRALTYGTVAQLDLVYHTGGKLELIGYNSSSAVIIDSGSQSFGADGTPLYVSMELQASGSNIFAFIRAVVPGSSSVTAFETSATGTVGFVSDVLVNPAGTLTDTATAVGWLTVQTYADTLANVSPVAGGYAGELASVRIARLCAQQQLGFELNGQDSDTPQMGPQQDGTFLNVLQSCADFDRGQLFETRDAFGLGYRTRVSMQGQSPNVVAFYGQGMLAAQPQPVADDQFTRNDITVTRNGGASSTATLTSGPMSVLDPPNGVGDYTYALTVQAFADTQLANLVAWLLNVGTVFEYRFPQLAFDMARTEAESLFGEIPALDVGDFLQVPDPPSFLQNYPINQLCWGFTETLNSTKWTISVNTVPESPYAEANPPAW